MDALSTMNQPPIFATLAALLLFGVAYAAIVRYVRRRNPDHGFTAFWVVGGNLAICVAFAAVAGLEAAALLFLCMAAAGLPMVVEYIAWWLADTDANRLEL